MRPACPIALLELIARLGFSKNKILFVGVPLTMIMFYDLRCTEYSAPERPARIARTVPLRLQKRR